MVRLDGHDGRPCDVGTMLSVSSWYRAYFSGLSPSGFEYISTLRNYLWPLWDDHNETLHDGVNSRRDNRTSTALATSGTS